MESSSLWSLRATSIRHRDRGLTLVFGSDGQVSLIGFDSGIAPQVPYTPTSANTGVMPSGTPLLPSGSTSMSHIPNLEATSVPLTGLPTPILSSTSTSFSSPLASSSYDFSSTTTDTDTSLPSVPTVNYPTPSPTPGSASRDHGVGAPFYLAIVLASISLIGCIAAFVAWWIRSRSRRRDLELDDPWNHRDTLSDTGSPFTDNAHAFKKTNQSRGETQSRPYYLPASIINRSSSNLLAVPNTIPALQGGTSRNRGVPSSRTINPLSRPGAERLQTGLSVQESTRTLGRLRIANRVPGDVTSGDEGGVSIPRLQSSVLEMSVANPSGGPGTVTVGESTMQNIQPAQNHRSVQEVDGPSEPPGPATLSWGRRMDTVAALRRTRRPPGMTIQAYKNSSCGESLYPASGGDPNGTNLGKDHAISLLEPPGWANSIKSSFWQAVDVVTGIRPSDNGTGIRNGSGFTPAPQRVASRRSPASSTSPFISSTLWDTHVIQSQETGTKYDSTLPNNPFAMPHDLDLSGLSAKKSELEAPRVNKFSLAKVDSPPPKVSRLNRALSASTYQHPNSLRSDTGSVYSTESAAALANLRKYGYGDSIPSNWSALGVARESLLNLDRPLTTSPRPLSSVPSQLTSDSVPPSSSVSMRARTPTQSESGFTGSDTGTLRFDKHGHAANHGAMSPMYGVSRNDTMQSGRATISHETSPSHLAPISSTLSRKKGVSARRKRPRLPPRAPSNASSVQSVESGLSAREMVVRKALLERRKKVKAAESLKGRGDSLTRDHDAGGFLVLPEIPHLKV